MKRYLTMALAVAFSIPTLIRAQGSNKGQCAPDNAGLKLPAGFCATIFATVAHQRGDHRDELGGGATNPLSQCHPDGSRCPISVFVSGW